MSNILEIYPSYPKADCKDRSNTSQWSGHTAIQAEDTVLGNDLLETVEGVLVKTVRCLEADLDQVKRLAVREK